VALTRRAMARVSEATGLEFVYDGLTDRRPRWRTPWVPSLTGYRQPVLVGFATDDEVPELAGAVAGIGGSVRVGTGSPRSTTSPAGSHSTARRSPAWHRLGSGRCF
jgi:hypothetical protein